MTDQITFDEIPEGGDRPATQRDLTMLRADLQRELAQKADKADLLTLRQDIGREIRDLRAEMKDLKTEITDLKTEIFDHFDAAVENIEESLRGANADEISLLQDSKEDHETRLTTLEHRVGLR